MGCVCDVSRVTLCHRSIGASDTFELRVRRLLQFVLVHVRVWVIIAEVILGRGDLVR